MSWPGLSQKCRRQIDGDWFTATVIRKKNLFFTIQYDDGTEEDVSYEDKDISPIGEIPAVESAEDVEQEFCTNDFENSNGHASENVAKWEEEPAQVLPADGFCAKCSNPSTYRCSICRIIFYCSRKCQRLSWSMHKTNCCAPKKSLLTQGIIDNRSSLTTSESKSSNHWNDDVGTELIDMSEDPQESNKNLKWPDGMNEAWATNEAWPTNEAWATNEGWPVNPDAWPKNDNNKDDAKLDQNMGDSPQEAVPVISTDPFANDQVIYCSPCDGSDLGNIATACVATTTDVAIDMDVVKNLMTMVEGMSEQRVIQALKEASGDADQAAWLLLTPSINDYNSVD